jgi:flagellar hook protein FlgE
MSLYSAFYASLSGLSSNANALAVIGNNLANLNTVGYKASDTSFEDLYNSALGGASTEGNGNPIQIGMGSALGSVSQDFSQGSPQSTGTVTNMALQGSGFFTLKTVEGSTAYTRAGDFTVDKNGYLVDPSGNQVLGWNATNGTVSTNGTPVPIFLNPGATSPPSATNQVSNTTNLDSTATSGTTFTTPISVYDTTGASHNLLVTYTKTANAGEWTMAVTTDGGATFDIKANGVDTGSNQATLQFDTNGNLTSPSANLALTMTGSWTNGATSPDITMENWTGTSSALTSYAQTSSTTSTTQNGYAAGTLSAVSVDDTGTLIGTFTNGQTNPLAQVAVTTFANENGLSKAGGNTWDMTLASGAPNVGTANTGGRGTVLGSNLESSNVDVATEFTKLIINQNGYQANSRVITTANTLLQTVISLIQ